MPLPTGSWILAALLVSAALVGCQGASGASPDASPADAEGGADTTAVGTEGGADASSVDADRGADAALDRSVSEAAGDDAAGDVVETGATDADASDAGTDVASDGVPSACPAPMVSCGGQCVDPSTSPLYCGATEGCGESGGNPGVDCPPFSECVAGACAVSCTIGLMPCNGTCIDPNTDNEHCGGCDLDAGGRVCVPPSSCVAGSCH
jgi:hypothetical protein